MEDSARFCPNCGSIRVEPDTSRSNVIGMAIGNPDRWVCRKCGYAGIMPTGDPEKGFSDGDLDFEPSEEHTQQDFSTGRAYFKYFFYITLPVLVIYFLYLQL